MNGWNRLFVVLAACWVVAAPFVLVAEANDPPERIFHMCADTAYQLYGSSSSVQLDVNKYRREMDVCQDQLRRKLVSFPMLLGAMVGIGELGTGLLMWGYIAIPLALLWVVGWVIGRTVIWVAAGFRARGPS